MGLKPPPLPGVTRLSSAAGAVRLAGPSHLTSALAEALSLIAVPSEVIPTLDVTLSPDARTADGVVDGRLTWSIALPPEAPIGTALGQIVGTLTTLLTRLLFVHAGVVTLNGRGMVLVGESGAGKTSTVAALLRNGARYLSDEVALLDPSAGAVLPFAIPMAVKPWTREAAGPLPPGRLVAREAGAEFWLPDDREVEPASVDTFVLLRNAASGPRLSPISRSAMLLAVAQQASSFKQQRRVRQAFAGFATLLRNARCLVFEAPRPAAAAALLLALARG